jgi:hypothetical protein
MKKSFMTRVLATGLSLAMAFSLSAATNVTTASAAAKPTLVTASGESAKSLSLKVGDVTKIKANAATKKTYKISAAKASSSRVKAAVSKAGTFVAIRGVKATIEGKPSAVKVSFTVKKTGKTSKYTYSSKVTVTEDKLTMTAEAAGVKKIAVTFNKAVDTAATTITVKKGSATPTITSTTFADDAKSADLVMGTKLTAGTYTVEVKSGDDTLTADITVQDEKLTSFALVSTNLVADASDVSAASISYKALNQYGEMMNISTTPQVTCSFGDTDAASTSPTADRSGTATIKNIPATLRIPGTVGTIVIVDTTTGVNLSESITYQSKAVASSATVYGIYDTKSEKLLDRNLKTGEKVTNYSLLINIQDQYGSDMTPTAVTNSGCTVSYNPASVLTNLSVTPSGILGDGTSETEITYDGKNCFLVHLTADASTTGTIKTAGTLSLTIVSANKGTIASPSFTVEDAVMIQTLNVSAKDTVYSNEENELVVEAIDTNGNAVTDYTSLAAAVSGSSLTGSIALKKNADGTGTFYYTPVSNSGILANKYKDSTIGTLLFTANDTTSGNYIVKNVTVTQYANRRAWKVSGTTSDTVTATTSGAALTFNLNTLTFEDQYSNTVKASSTTPAVSSGAVSAYLVSNGVFASGSSLFAADYEDLSSEGVVEVTSSGAIGDAHITLYGAKNGTGYLYLKYSDNKESTASAIDYDVKVALSVQNVTDVTADELTLTVNKGNTIYGVTGVAIVTADASADADYTGATGCTASAVVTAVRNGKKVVIPSDQVTIIEGKTLGNYGFPSSTSPAKTEEKTVTAIVDSENGPQTISTTVTVSNVAPTATVLKSKATLVSNAALDGGATVTGGDIIATLKVLDQYAQEMTSYAATAVDYTVKFTGTNATAAQEKVEHDSTYRIEIDLDAGDYTADVTYKTNNLTFTQSVKIHVGP